MLMEFFESFFPFLFLKTFSHYKKFSRYSKYAAQVSSASTGAVADGNK